MMISYKSHFSMTSMLFKNRTFFKAKVVEENKIMLPGVIRACRLERNVEKIKRACTFIRELRVQL